MADCIFCNILRGAAPASIVFSDEMVTAFMDIQPVNLGHVLVIPNIHAAHLSELDEEVGARLFKVAMRIAAAVKRSGVRCEGVNLFLADGKAAFQEIFHDHLHIIPRFTGNGFGLKFGSNYGLRPSEDELDKIAKRIKGTICNRNTKRT